MVKLTKSALVLGLAFLGMNGTPPTAAESIKYCEEISDKLGKYANKDELFQDLTVKAQRKALTQLLQTELAQFESKVLSQDAFIDTLLHLVEYQAVEQASDGLLTPCIVLQEAEVKEEHRKRFTPVEVGRVCSFDDALLAKQIEQMKGEFVARFYQRKGEEQKPASIAALLAEPEKVGKKFGKKLEDMLRQSTASPTESAVEDTKCGTLSVYPIEMYALSVPYMAEVKPEKSAELSKEDLQKVADNQARWHGLDPQLFRAVINQESKWEQTAVSQRGAVGLAQLMPTTAKEECGLGKTELNDPHENLGCGAHYLAKNLDRFNDVRLALCAYNAGPGAVAGGKCGEYKETRQYVRNIMTALNRSDG